MTRISRFQLNESVLSKLFSLFFQIVGNKNDPSEFHQVITDLLSPVERIMVAKRIAIIYLLMKKINYLTICDVLKVSQATVAKFSLLMEKSEGIVPTLNRIVKNEKISQFLEELSLELFPPGRRGVDWKAAWQRKYDLERRKSQGI